MKVFLPTSARAAASSAASLLSVGLFLPASAEVREYEWTLRNEISNADPASPLNLDCHDGRLMALVDGMHPGPALRANVGDTVRVKIKNELVNDGTSVHWHGLHMSEEPYMDGVAKFTQCSLPASGEQTYEFVVREPGTHYWHSHIALQHSDGMAGPLYVYDGTDSSNDGSYGGFSETGGVGPYDGELELFLQDWFHMDSNRQAAGLLSEPFRWIFNPQAILVNGRGQYLEVEEECPLDPSVLSVEPGKTYRVRIVNSANLVGLNVGIAGHKMTIVEADGTPTKPVEVQTLDVTPGQRYSVLITADGEPGMDYAISVHNRGRDMKSTSPGVAILRYSGVDDAGSEATSTSTTPGTEEAGTVPASEAAANSTSPATDEGTGKESEGGLLQNAVVHPDPLFYGAPYGIAFDETLRTKDVPAEDKEDILNADPDLSYVVVGTQNRRQGDNNLRWAVNNISMPFPEETTIAYMYDQVKDGLVWADSNEELDMGANYVDLPKVPPVTWNYTMDHKNLDPGPGPTLGSMAVPVVRAKVGQNVQMVFQNSRALNGVAEFHPWHMHGHSFYIVGMGEGTYDPDVHDATFNLEDPLRRDTFTLWPNSWIAVRYLARHPGVWFFHCHLNSHIIMGMGFLLIVSPDEIGAPPPYATRSCNQNDLVGGGEDDSSGGGASNAGTSGGVMPTLLLGWVSLVVALIAL